MGPFFLVLLTLNPSTGDLLSSTVVGDPYQSIAACVRAAVDRGPLKAGDGKATLLICRTERRDYVWEPSLRHDPS
jgi:hypothetical protein